jgi:spermidine synthase
MPESINQSRFPVTLSVILPLFFASGALALIYQVVWSRMMTHVFGSTAVAVGTVLAAFMCGMAIGSWLFGKLADRSRNCLRLYAWLEIGIAISALASHFALDAMRDAYPALHALLGSSGSAVLAARFVVAFLLVAAPTFLMGATLPVLARFLAARTSQLGLRLSSLYAVNTLGAVCGVLVTGFVLIGQYGLHAPVYAAALANFAVGTLAWLLSRTTRMEAFAATSAAGVAAPQETAPEQGRHRTGPERGTYLLVLFGLGLSGLTSFAYEIYWTRALVFVLGNSTYALTTMLASFLTGIALGGYLVRFLLARAIDRAAAFGWLQLGIGFFSAVALPTLFAIDDPQALGRYMLEISSQAVPMVITGFGTAFVVMLVPATLIGATFPLVGQLAAREDLRTGSSVGWVYAVNTVGNVFGALLPGFVLLSWFGIQGGILFMAVLNIILGFVVLAVRWMRPGGLKARRWVPAVAALLLLAAISRVPFDFEFPSESERPGDQTLFYREGPLATTKVYARPGSGDKFMSVDRVVIGGTGYTEFKQLLLAHLPKLLLDDVSTELSVGLGSGILVGESGLHDRVREITAVEIEPGVIEGAAWFDSENHDILDDDRLTVVYDDVQNFLKTTPGRYRVISADEKTADEYASNGFSYSLEYYRLLGEHLEEGGLLAQWVPATLPPRQYRMILRTFTEAFPEVQLWYFLPAHERGPFNSVLIGSNEPIPVEYEAVQRRFEAQPEAFSSLARYGLTSAETLLPHFIAGGATIRQAVSDAPLNTLDHPRYEFYYPWEYAVDREQRFIANHELNVRLKREALADYVKRLGGEAADNIRLQKALIAEDRYLVAFRQFLMGMPLEEQYRVFDRILAMAPFNDSLRARIYAQYAYAATTRRDPAERARLMKKAGDLYPTGPE